MILAVVLLTAAALLLATLAVSMYRTDRRAQRESAERHARLSRTRSWVSVTREGALEHETVESLTSLRRGVSR